MKTRLPKLCRNKLRDAAFVYCGKRKIYLGKWGAPETIAAYRRYIAELASGRVSVAESVPNFTALNLRAFAPVILRSRGKRCAMACKEF